MKTCDINLSSFQAVGAFPCADALSSFKLSLSDIARSVSRSNKQELVSKFLNSRPALMKTGHLRPKKAASPFLWHCATFSSASPKPLTMLPPLPFFSAVTSHLETDPLSPSIR